MTAPPATLITVVADHLCPWCYIGLANPERIASEFDVRFDWLPWQRRPLRATTPVR